MRKWSVFALLLVGFAVASTLATSRSWAAEDGAEEGISQRINDAFSPVVKAASKVMFWDPFAAVGLYDPVVYDAEGRAVAGADGQPKRVGIPLVVAWLVFAGVFFTIRMKLVNFRGFVHAIALVRGKFADPDSPGQVTHFQALTTAVSGTVGLGNIAGVAIAVALGGPGATFWMILAGIFGMATKFVECTLGVKYRVISADGEVSGGPPYYLSRGLGGRRFLGPVGKALGACWALLAVLGSLGGGNMFQANQTFVLAADMFPFLQGKGAHFGLGLALLVGLVIIGGIKGIARVTSKIVPGMAVLYVVTCLVIIAVNIGEVGQVFALIVREAFSAPATHGGFIGVMVTGLRRAAFSNEAGVGTSAIAHAAAQTREPVAEGVVGLHEPFIDTVVICTMTALVLIFTGTYQGAGGATGAALTAAAFGSVQRWLPYVLMLAIVLFSFSTLISFSYYGVKCFDYCFGGLFERVFRRRAVATHVYRLIFLVCVVIGASTNTTAVMNYSDMIIFGLIVTNTAGLFLLSSDVKREHDAYFGRLRSGELGPR